jgi:uncharacterized membrane protein YeaQ/YmgE (transglycosylase-associated protein family)
MISGLSCSVAVEISSDGTALQCSTGFVVTDDQLFGVTQDQWDAVFLAVIGLVVVVWIYRMIYKTINQM